MNNLELWYKNNEQYLMAAIAWLQLRLLKLANSLDNTDQLDQAYAAMTVAAAAQPPPALVILAQRLDLSEFEQQVLLLGAAMEMNTGFAELCNNAQGNQQRPYPTFALALALFDDPAWDILSPERPLRYWRLIEINQPGAQLLTVSALRADERIVNYIKGLNYLDDRLAPLLTRLEDAEVELPPSQEAIVDTIVQCWQQGISSDHLPAIQLLGNDTTSKQLIATHAAAAINCHLYRLSAGLLPALPGDLENLLRLWQRESILMPVALYLDARDVENSTQLKSFLSRYRGVLIVDTREPLPELERLTISLDAAKPTSVEQTAAWQQIISEFATTLSLSLSVADAAEISGQLASQFNLDLGAIQQAAQLAANQAADVETFKVKLWDSCLVLTRPRLDSLAQRIDTKATGNDIILPTEEIDLLQQIAQQVRQRSLVYQTWGFERRANRGLGISVLFAGDSGTGKTMAAEVIANQLHLNLYRIDLSAVVSKYIGETEKNLGRLFDAAEDGGAILFFDEADALFGKRSEVKDSRDRYANIEIDYLLQRIEAYRGLAILATNMKTSLDPAFMRRLRFVVNFPFPGIAERQLIWQKVFPAQTPTSELDYARLARLNLTGGSIYNVALNAAFLAASSGSAVTMSVVLAAARTEFRKLDRPINEADFRLTQVVGVSK